MKKLKRWCKGLAVMSVLIVLAAVGTAWGDATYSSNGELHLSPVDVPGYGMYDVYLMATDSTGQKFVLKSVSQIAPGLGAVATYDPATGKLHIPYLVMTVVNNTAKYAEVELELVPNSDPIRFKVTGVLGLQIGSDDRGPQGVAGPIGTTGLQGPIGLTGPTGPTGATGAASTVPGPTGATGAQGPAGAPATDTKAVNIISDSWPWVNVPWGTPYVDTYRECPSGYAMYGAGGTCNTADSANCGAWIVQDFIWAAAPYCQAVSFETVGSATVGILGSHYYPKGITVRMNVGVGEHACAYGAYGAPSVYCMKIE